MKLTVSICDKTHQVEVPDPGAVPLRIIVDGQPFDVTTCGGAMHAAPAPQNDERSTVATNAAPLPSLPHEQRRQPASPHDRTVNGIIAPMPGTVLSIEVQPGQMVVAGQVVCILEAMKMKNPIRAISPGIVSEVNVQAGQTVIQGAVLVSLTSESA